MLVVLIFFIYLLTDNEHSMLNTEHNHSLNRLKIVLVEQGKNGRQLAERLNKSEHTISRWCKNKTLPSVAQLHEIKNGSMQFSALAPNQTSMQKNINLLKFLFRI